MRSHWPTAISTEPPCTQLTPSSANEHVENADTRGAEIAQNEPLPIDPLENTFGGYRGKLDSIRCGSRRSAARSPDAAGGATARGREMERLERRLSEAAAALAKL